MDVVRRIASSLRRRLPPGRAELEELEADGFEALVRALRVYHSSKGPLIPYIVLRNQPMYLLLQMWVGGWSGDPDASTPNVLETQVDHVSVWQVSSAGWMKT